MHFRVTRKPYNEKKSVAAILYGLRRVCAGLIIGALLLLPQRLGVSCRRATMTICTSIGVSILYIIGAIFLRVHGRRIHFVRRAHFILPAIIAARVANTRTYNIIGYLPLYKLRYSLMSIII